MAKITNPNIFGNEQDLTGRVSQGLTDFFDTEDAELSSPNSVFSSNEPTVTTPLQSGSTVPQQAVATTPEAPSSTPFQSTGNASGASTPIGAVIGGAIDLSNDFIQFGVNQYFEGKATHRKLKELRKEETKAVLRRNRNEKLEAKKFDLDLGFRQRSEQRTVENADTQKRVQGYQNFMGALTNKLNTNATLREAFIKNGHFPRR